MNIGHPTADYAYDVTPSYLCVKAWNRSRPSDKLVYRWLVRRSGIWRNSDLYVAHSAFSLQPSTAQSGHDVILWTWRRTETCITLTGLRRTWRSYYSCPTTDTFYRRVRLSFGARCRIWLFWTWRRCIHMTHQLEHRSPRGDNLPLFVS